MATYDYLYFNLRLTSLEDEAETLRRAKTRAVGGLSLGGPARGDEGGAGFPSYHGSP